MTPKIQKDQKIVVYCVFVGDDFVKFDFE
jgi:hypothetical protein